MERSSSSDRIYDKYFKTFPDSGMFDSRAMDLSDFERTESMMSAAIERGSPINSSDLKFPVDEPDPELGLVF